MSGRLVGILGGMGPEASAELYRRVIRLTDAAIDQDHVPLLVYSNPDIPDRSAAILEGGATPLPALRESVRRLAAAGAETIAIACNTAHHFFDGIQSAVDVPILHMVRASAEWTATNLPDVRRVGLLATTGTVRCGLYDDAFAEVGLEVCRPSETSQARVMEAIYRVKAGKQPVGPAATLAEVGQELVGQGAQALVLGCTEVSVALGRYESDVPLVDPLDVVAAALIHAARGA